MRGHLRKLILVVAIFVLVLSIVSCSVAIKMVSSTASVSSNAALPSSSMPTTSSITASASSGDAPTTYISFIDAENGFGVGTSANPNSILYTSDGGKTWSTLPAFPDTSLTPKKISFLNIKTGFLLCSNSPEENGISGENGVLYATNDGGETWAKTADLSTFLRDYGFPSYFRMFDAQNGIICCQESGTMEYLRTKDGGKTWTLAFGDGQGQGPPTTCAFDNADRGVIFYLGANFALYSGGKVGSIMENDVINVDMHCYAVAMRSNKIVAYMYEVPVASGVGSYNFNIIVSEDDGHSWNSVPLPTPVSKTLISEIKNGEIVTSCMDFPDPNNGFLMISAFSSLLYTTDGGNTWNWR